MRAVPRHVTQRLAEVPLFSGLNQHELRTVAVLGTSLTVEHGVVLTKEGAVGDEAFLILSGEATCTRGGTPLGTLGEGDFLGEISLLDGASRSATVMAATDMDVIVFTRREFVALVEASPRIAMKLLTALGSRIRLLDERVANG